MRNLPVAAVYPATVLGTPMTFIHPGHLKLNSSAGWSAITNWIDAYINAIIFV